MTTGAVGFIGERLTEARNARGISAVDLAGIVGVSPQSISKYENGHQSPRREVLYSIASALRFPRDFFFRPIVHNDRRPVFWRGRLSAPVGMQERARARLHWMKETVDYLAGYFDFPALDIPHLPVQDIETVGEDFIENAAAAIREHWGISPGPMPDVIERLELHGILVSRIHVNAEKLDAFSQWSDKYQIPFIVLGRDKSSAVRQRFDALHELAHIVIHGNLTVRHLNNKSSYKIIESQADRLASSLLLPETEFLNELYAPSLDAFLSMKERWGTSVAAMIMRCNRLGLLSDDESRRMWINYGRRGWRKQEPLDNKIQKEEPHLLRKGFEMLLSEGVQSIADIRRALPFPLSDLEEIADLEPGTLGETVESRARPQFKDNPAKSKVVQFVKN